jgi:hypothetical protein
VKIRHSILIALFAFLQGMAPLLHAHMGTDATGVSGVHMHGVPHAVSGNEPESRWSGAGPLETQVVGLGQEIRRELSWQPLDVAPAHVHAWDSGPFGSFSLLRIACEVPPVSAARHLVPPSHAPPPILI